MVSDDVLDNSWIAGGETVFFQGAMWYVGTEDAPLDNMFDVRVSREGWVEVMLEILITTMEVSLFQLQCPTPISPRDILSRFKLSMR